MGIQMDGTVYRENVDITREEFYASLDEVRSLSTSQPSPGDFLDVYRQAAEHGRTILSIHITGRQSGTVQSARLDARETDRDVIVYDSQSCSMGQGFMALAAAEQAQRGGTADEIVPLLDRMKRQTQIWAAVPTLAYLARSGKIPRIQALLANVLNIKPILSMVEGNASMVAKARSYPKALSIVLDRAEQFFGSQPLRVAVLHTYAPAAAERFREQVERKLACRDLFLSDMGTALAVHGGRGMLGLAACPVETNT